MLLSGNRRNPLRFFKDLEVNHTKHKYHNEGVKGTTQATFFENTSILRRGSDLDGNHRREVCFLALNANESWHLPDSVTHLKVI